jgi:hypothetical protein
MNPLTTLRPTVTSERIGRLRATLKAICHTYDDNELRERAAEALEEDEATAALAAPVAPAAAPSPTITAKDVIAAIYAIDREAARRGEMFPQTSDEQREDRRAMTRIMEMIRWYEKNTGCARIKGWPTPTAAAPSLEPASPPAPSDVDSAQALRQEAGAAVERPKRLPAAERRMEAAVASFQKYMTTYSDQQCYRSYSDETFILDALYGIGIALDADYKFATGFGAFKHRVWKLLSLDCATPSTAAAGHSPAGPDPDAWEPVAMLLAEQAGDDPHQLIWEGNPPEPWGEVWIKYESQARAIVSLIAQKTINEVHPAPTRVAPADLTDARQTLIDSLRASKGWTTGYAAAFVDDFAAAPSPEPK